MDKAGLFAAALPEDDVETHAGTIRVRGLSRAEVFKLKRYTYAEQDQLDQKMLEWGVVEPKLTEAEVRAWRAAWTTDQLDAVTERIAELSGMPTDKKEPATEDERERTFHGDTEGV